MVAQSSSSEQFTTPRAGIANDGTPTATGIHIDQLVPLRARPCDPFLFDGHSIIRSSNFQHLYSGLCLAIPEGSYPSVLSCRALKSVEMFADSVGEIVGTSNVSDFLCAWIFQRVNRPAHIMHPSVAGPIGRFCTWGTEQVSQANGEATGGRIACMSMG